MLAYNPSGLIYPVYIKKTKARYGFHQNYQKKDQVDISSGSYQLLFSYPSYYLFRS